MSQKNLNLKIADGNSNSISDIYIKSSRNSLPMKVNTSFNGANLINQSLRYSSAWSFSHFLDNLCKDIDTLCMQSARVKYSKLAHLFIFTRKKTFLICFSSVQIFPSFFLKKIFRKMWKLYFPFFDPYANNFLASLYNKNEKRS